MASVTQRIKQTKQPRGGYVNPRTFFVKELDSKKQLNPKESISPVLIGLVVDYLSRYMTGAKKEEAFKISLIGSQIIDDIDYALKLLKEIDELNNLTVINACKLVGYDVLYRRGIEYYKDVRTIEPDQDTIDNIKEMVNRSINFFNINGPVVLEGFNLKGAYTHLITIGDGDFLTKDALWDFKVSVSPPKSKDTLQLMIYYLMGLKSVHFKHFKKLTKIGIYNPRLNKVFTKEIKDIDKEIIEEISSIVIGY